MLTEFSKKTPDYRGYMIYHYQDTYVEPPSLTKCLGVHNFLWKCAICTITAPCRLHTFIVNYVHPSGWFCLVAPHIWIWIILWHILFTRKIWFFLFNSRAILGLTEEKEQFDFEIPQLINAKPCCVLDSRRLAAVNAGKKKHNKSIGPLMVYNCRNSTRVSLILLLKIYDLCRALF